MGTLEKMLDKLQESEKKVNEFADVLDSIENTSDKKKMLWKQIYEHAIVDRTNAYMLFTNLYSQMGTSASDHATLGVTLTKYLERMSKSNEQLLNLAKLIAESESAAPQITEDDIFNKIKG
jgi:uncharacterized protein Yka (UPF0111/DUF47 family)